MNANIKNFCIIAHIDHGKSTLADRFLELTKTIDKNKMKPQLLDRMDLERERGITIKMQPVRMSWKDYELNLIDTPGHVDFSYEVSRALRAVEGAILLVDGTKGIQAQTIANLKMAQDLGLKIIPAINKIDACDQDQIENVKEQISKLIDVDKNNISLISAKTGKGVEELLDKVITEIPNLEEKNQKTLSALIFDSVYDKYKGVIAYVRVFGGSVKTGDKILLYSQNQIAEATEVGYFAPEFKKSENLSSGEIGYIATNLKNLDNVKIGDSLTLSPAEKNFEPIKGFKEPTPMVFASFFPLKGEEINRLKDSLEKFRLSDSALNFEPEVSNTYGSGFKCSFLGLLHLEIVKERLKREFGQDLIVTTPSVSYKILKTDNSQITIQKAEDMPDRSEIKTISEPWVKLEILSPSQYLSQVINLINSKRGYLVQTDNFDKDHLNISAHLPLSSLVIDFYDGLKNATQGFASLNYEFLEYREAKLAKLDILINGEPAQGLARIIPYSEVRDTGANVLKKLKTLIPRQMIAIALQAKVDGDIVAREDISALRKDVTAKLYGGDVTRKNKLLKKQAKGKKKMKEIGKVQIPSDTYIKMLKI